MESSNPKLSFRAGGSSLIEVLVALAVLSLGLAGAAATQMAILQHVREVVHQSRAALHGADMAEWLRATVGVGESADMVIERWRGQVESSLPAGRAVVCIDSTPRDGAADAPACDGAGTAWAIKIWWDDNHDGHPESARFDTLRL